jgi:thymidylate synthase
MEEDHGVTIDEHYQALLATILEHGIEKKDRTGTGTKSIFGYSIRHDMSQGFPLLTTKKMAYKSMITELRWFLKGDTNIKYLVDNGCNIWNGDAFKNYCKIAGSYKEPDYDVHVDDPKENCIRLMTMQEFTTRIKADDKFASKWGDLGPVYGKQWRGWDSIDDRGMQNSIYKLDQIKDLLEELKTNPDSRRLMVSAWNVGELTNMILPPCHYGFQMYTTELTELERQEIFCNRLGKDLSYAKSLNHYDYDGADIPKRKLSLLWSQRSCDVFLGLPFNLASYALLLKLIAAEVNMIPDQLVGNLGDTHLYLNHIEQAKEQLNRDPMMLSELFVSNVNILEGEFDVHLNDYISHPTIKAQLSN